MPLFNCAHPAEESHPVADAKRALCFVRELGGRGLGPGAICGASRLSRSSRSSRLDELTREPGESGNCRGRLVVATRFDAGLVTRVACAGANGTTAVSRASATLRVRSV